MEQSCAAYHGVNNAAKPAEIPTKTLPLMSITVPEYFIREIPEKVKSIYEVLGIKYVHVRKGADDYFILSTCLETTLNRLNLYC